MAKMTENPGKTPDVISSIHAPLKTFGRLGRQIKITPKSHISINKPGYKAEYFTETIEVLIGIGNDHTARLIMDTDAWDALQQGAKIDITTTEEYKNQYVRKIRKRK